MSAIAGDLTKWRARKVRGSWEVARPTQINSVIAFGSFTEMLAWHPDCTRFYVAGAETSATNERPIPPTCGHQRERKWNG
jgi:hypothetical protein